MSEDKPTEPTDSAQPTDSTQPADSAQPTQTPEPTVSAPPPPPAPTDPYDYFGGFNSKDALKAAHQKAKDEAGGEINLTASDIKAGLAEIPATFKAIRKGRRYTGGQWFLSFALLFSVWVAFSGDGDFNFLAFIIMFGILWLISAPFRVAGWAVRRANSRPCSVCGIRIPNGETACQSCGTDFTIR